MNNKKETVYLIDGNSFIYRMFFALPKFTRQDGHPVGATFGMAKFFLDQIKNENPDFIFYITDAPGKNFRHEVFTEYKATRDKMPDDLKLQISDIEKLVKTLDIDQISIEGYEADDVIARIATQLSKNKNVETYILSIDKDLFALVDDTTFIYDTQKKKIYDREKVLEKFGIYPEQVRDYLAICGDTSDNIPGIKGIGPKKAISLLRDVGTLEEIYDLAKKVQQNPEVKETLSPEVQKIFSGKTFEKLLDGEENAFLSKELATLKTDIPELETIFDGLTIDDKFSFDAKTFETPQVYKYMLDFGFESLVPEEKKQDLLMSWEDINQKVNIVGDSDGLTKLDKKIFSGYKEIVLDTETTSLSVIDAKLVGISILLEDTDGTINMYYINAGHDGPKVDSKELKDFITKILDSDLTIICHNLKYDIEILKLYLKGYDDKVDVDNLSDQMPLF